MKALTLLLLTLPLQVTQADSAFHWGAYASGLTLGGSDGVPFEDAAVLESGFVMSYDVLNSLTLFGHIRTDPVQDNEILPVYAFARFNVGKVIGDDRLFVDLGIAANDFSLYTESGLNPISRIEAIQPHAMYSPVLGLSHNNHFVGRRATYRNGNYEFNYLVGTADYDSQVSQEFELTFNQEQIDTFGAEAIPKVSHQITVGYKDKNFRILASYGEINLKLDSDTFVFAGFTFPPTSTDITRRFKYIGIEHTDNDLLLAAEVVKIDQDTEGQDDLDISTNVSLTAAYFITPTIRIYANWNKIFFSQQAKDKIEITGEISDVLNPFRNGLPDVRPEILNNQQTKHMEFILGTRWEPISDMYIKLEGHYLEGTLALPRAQRLKKGDNCCNIYGVLSLSYYWR